MPPELSIIIPAYNEGERLGRGLSRIRDYFASQPGGVAGIEILVVDDGSTDDTARIAQDWARDMPSLRLVSNPENRGKGYSVRHGMLEARGRVAIFTDADLSITDRGIGETAERHPRRATTSPSARARWIALSFSAINLVCERLRASSSTLSFGYLPAFRSRIPSADSRHSCANAAS